MDEFFHFLLFDGVLGWLTPDNHPIIDFIGGCIIAIFIIMAILYQNNLTQRYIETLEEKNRNTEVEKTRKYRNYMIFGSLIAFILLHVISAF